MRPGLISLIVVITVAAAGTAAQQNPASPGQPRFDARADVVLVDVSVVDGDGRPVEGLSASDFQLEVNGQSRAIQHVQYISTLGAKSVRETSARDAQSTSNDAASSGRLLLFIVDENHLRVSGNRGVLNTAGRLLDMLAPGDLVGLARLPDGQGGVEFTVDRLRVRRGLEGVTGRQPSRNLNQLRLSEAWAFENNDRFTWERVIERECGSGGGGAGGSFAAAMGYQACVKQQEAEARSAVNDAAARASQTIRSLEQLMVGLVPMRMPISVVLISEGLFVGRDRNDLSVLLRRAAEAHVTLHIVQPGESIFDNDKPEVLGGGLRDDNLLGQGLDMLAGQTRGAHYTISSNGDGAFERIRRELSGYYLLSFEPTAADRSVPDRRIKVTVNRRGATIRARSTYALPDAASNTTSAAAAPQEQVQQLLVAPLPSSGLPIRVASYSVTSEADAKIRVIVAAEIGEPATSDAEWPVGLLVLDKNGTSVVNTIGLATLAPASPRTESPRLMLKAMVLDPGEYTLRLAAASPEGRSGSVHHIINAHLERVGGGLTASDLMISARPVVTDDAPRPTPSAIVDSDELTASLELHGTDGQRLARARLKVEIAESEAGPALVAVEAQRASRTGGVKQTFAAGIKVGLLPPGEYVARAILSTPGQPDARFIRAFRTLPPPPSTTSGVSAAAPRDPDRAPDSLAPSRIIAPIPRFVPDDVLKPEVVNVFLDALQQRHPVSAATAPLIGLARTGTFVSTPSDGSAPEGDEPALAFLRGLAALQRKEIAQAAAWFQLSLKAASDFLGAVFYLGAVHAASGNDLNAVGAWQMSLIGEGGDRAYPVLVDALLRTGDAQGALDLIAEAPEAWPSDEARHRRVAIAQAMLGQYGVALEGVNALLAKSPADLDLLFVALQVLYRRHAESPLAGQDKTRFAEYAARYQLDGGPQAALVASWVRQIVK